MYVCLYTAANVYMYVAASFAYSDFQPLQCTQYIMMANSHKLK